MFDVLQPAMRPEMGKGSSKRKFKECEKDDACVRVVVRVRPNSTPPGGKCLCLLLEDDSAGSKSCHTIQTGEHTSSMSYSFDHVFPTSTNQEDLYSTCVESLVRSCLEGYNGTIFAYGQTGSGKTHSMLGDLRPQNSEAGVIPRALEQIFRSLEQRTNCNTAEATMERSQTSSLDLPSRKNPFEYHVKVQILELYGEEIHDLLGNEGGDQPQSSDKEIETSNRHIGYPNSSVKYSGCLAIRDGKIGEDAEVIGACNIEVKSAEEAMRTLHYGMIRRRTEKTAMNSESSRSHAIFSLIIQQIQRKSSVIQSATEKESIEMKTSKMHFVDLAGSERIKSAKTKGIRMKEGISINKGLFVLGNVISALGNDKNKVHVPYRDSKLTRLLKGSLGGNHKTLMIACTRDCDDDESINTLRYANRAKNIKNNAIVNIDPSSRVINALRSQVAALATELLRVRKNLDDDDDCPFSTSLLNNFINDESALISVDNSFTTTTSSNISSSAPNNTNMLDTTSNFLSRPSTAPSPFQKSFTAFKIPDHFSNTSLRRSRSDSSLKDLIPVSERSIETFSKPREVNDDVVAFFNKIRVSLMRALEVEETENNHIGNQSNTKKIRMNSSLGSYIHETLKILDSVESRNIGEEFKGALNSSGGRVYEAGQIALYDAIRASLSESLSQVKSSAPDLLTNDKQDTWEIVAAPEFRNEYEGGDSNTKINDTPLDTEESTCPKLNSCSSRIGCSPPSTALKSSTASQNDLIYLNENHTQLCTGADDASKIDEYSKNERKTSVEDTLQDLSISDEECDLTTDCYQQGYKALKIQNDIDMMVTKTKNYRKEKAYLENIMPKLQEKSFGFINLSKSIKKLDRKVAMLTIKRRKILKSELYKNMNTSFRTIKRQIFDIKHKGLVALESQCDMTLSTESFSSSGGTVSKLQAKGISVAKGEYPIPTILHLNKSISGSKSTLKNDEQSTSSRKYRKILLRCSKFIMKPFIPLLTCKKKDDTLPFPLRL